MQMDDIPAVMKVERESFSMPWPGNAYKRELRENRMARYVVARRTGPPLQGDEPPPAEPDVPGVIRHPTWGQRLSRFFLGGSGVSASPTEIASRRVVGYAGLWLMVDEAHITAIAVAPAYRGFGVGELLLLSMVDISREIGAHYLTLEVRVSNNLAQNLYRKYGFKETGVRRRYYSDDNEDALIMWSDPLDSPSVQEMVENHRRALQERFKSAKVQAELRARSAQT